MAEAPSAPPGWYPFAKMPGSQRYWDGERWTEHVAPLVRPDDSTDRLEVWGWIGAFVFPLVGVVIGIMLLSRPGKNDGGWILGLSVGWIVLAWFILTESLSGQAAYYSY